MCKPFFQKPDYLRQITMQKQESINFIIIIVIIIIINMEFIVRLLH